MQETPSLWMLLLSNDYLHCRLKTDLSQKWLSLLTGFKSTVILMVVTMQNETLESEKNCEYRKYEAMH